MSDDQMHDTTKHVADLASLWQTIQQKGFTVLDYTNALEHIETVGCFHSFGFPDVVIHALDSPTAGRLLHAYVAASRAGMRFVYGRTYTHQASGRFLQLHPLTEGYARVFHLWELFGVQVTPWAQLVWSDQAGRWPWSIHAEGNCRRLQHCFTAHGCNWGTTRPGYEPRSWDRPFTTWDDALTWKQQIQTAMVRGGWRTPAQAATRMEEWERARQECEAMERGR